MTTILIIDDEKPIRDLLRTSLEILGHKIIEATDGKEAFDILQSSSPTLVIADIFMPKIDGLEFIRNAKSQNSHLKIIATSGGFPMKDVDVLKVAKRLGATHTLQKPFDVYALTTIVQNLLPIDPPLAHCS